MRRAEPMIDTSARDALLLALRDHLRGELARAEGRSGQAGPKPT